MSSEVLTAGHDEHGHAHNPNHQHHFHDMEQQADASKIGMWLFLATEVLLFGGLFVGYGMMQMKFPLDFKSAHHHLDWRMGALNTIVLLFSSFTMVMGVWAAQTNQKAKLKMYLAITWLCALTFMVVKYFEYEHKIHLGLLPGAFFSYQGPHMQNEFIFFSFYFMMTGLHGIHVLGGMAVIGWLYLNADRFNSEYYTPVDLVGLYWHLVDLIWIYLFPLYYLIS
jgi:cytochrome c oxidase subunit III